MKLTKQDIIKHSRGYHHTHEVTDSDVEKANIGVQWIERTRSKEHPVIGDIFICKGPNDVIYNNGHLDNSGVTEYSAICVKPYVPFLSLPLYRWTDLDKNRLPSFSTSGGYWFSIPEDKIDQIKYVGTRKKLFNAWGHCGACGNGAFTFEAEVNVWEIYLESIY